MAILTARPRNTLKIRVQRVRTAYLAKRIDKDVPSGETYEYTFKSDGNRTKTKKQKKKIAKIIFKNEKKKGNLNNTDKRTSLAEIISAFEQEKYNKGDCLSISLLKSEVSFEKQKTANLGDKLYVVIQTENMPDREIKMNLNQGDKKVLTDVKEPIYITQNDKVNLLFTATVGEFAKKNKDTIINASNFTDYAIAKIKLTASKENNTKYKDALTNAKDKKSKMYLVVDAEPEDNDWPSVIYEEVFENRPNLWYYGDGNWFEIINTNVIHIYHDGKISKLDFKTLKQVEYIYHDKNNKTYSICTCDLLEVDERLKGVADDQKDKHTVEKGYDKDNIITYTHDSSRKKYTYTDGTIRTYGKYSGKYRRVVYKKGTSKKYIVKMPKNLDVKINDSKVITFNFTSTARTYCNPESFAGFIGALAENGYSDIISTGMCEEDGTCFPSTTHNNGQSVDTKYLRKGKNYDTEREQLFINSMHKFGFKTQYRGPNRHKYSHTTSKNHHDSHLHSGGFKANYKK